VEVPREGQQQACAQQVPRGRPMSSRKNNQLSLFLYEKTNDGISVVGSTMLLHETCITAAEQN
jgi:poly-beta-hydroxyalkanoate depolymerase